MASTGKDCTNKANAENMEGVHVGDLFYLSWGSEQTNVEFWQVVALRGKHSAVIREIDVEYIGGYRESGLVHAKRDSFIGEPRIVRTRKSRYYKDGRAEVNAPNMEGRSMTGTTDKEIHRYSSYA